MRKSTLVILSAALLLLAVICTAGCVTDDQSSAGTQSAGDRPVAVCTNGVFVGAYEEKTGVASFKGIPFAQQPV